MTHPKKQQYKYPTDRAVATAGLVRGPVIPQAKNWWNSFAGLSGEDLAQYKDGYMDSPTDRNSNGSDIGGKEPSPVATTGGAAGPM